MTRKPPPSGGGAEVPGFIKRAAANIARAEAAEAAARNGKTRRRRKRKAAKRPDAGKIDPVVIDARSEAPDFAAVDAKALEVAAELLTRLLPGGRCVGTGLFKGAFPDAPGADDSLAFSLTTGKWFDADTGTEGDGLVSLVARLDHCEREDAAVTLEAEMLRVEAGWDEAMGAPVTGPPELGPGTGGGGDDGGDEDGAALDRLLMGERRNDIGNARRLIARHGADLMHVTGAGWHVWDGLRWAPDPDDGVVTKRCHRTAEAVDGEARAIAAAAGGALDPDTKKRIVAVAKWAVASGNAARLVAMARHAAPYLAVAVGELDQSPFLINTGSGTLAVGPARDDEDCVSLRDAVREDRLTRRCAVDFDPQATCPRFEALVARSLPDREARNFIQRYLGYCGSGDVSEQIIMLWHGEGANGKSTILNIVSFVYGDYAMRLPFASLLHDDRRGGADASPDIARLAGARLVAASEPDTGARFSEALLKQLAGGERMIARHLHRDFFEFDPQFKLVLLFNNRPAIRGQDKAIWRRLALVPFDVIIPETEKELRLDKKIFDAEGPGILNWLLDGLRLWREGGLAVPDVVRAATRDYREEEDPVGQFLAACTKEVEFARVQARVLFDAYTDWCAVNAFQPVSNTLFGRMIRERGIRRETVGVRFYVGIELTVPPEYPEGSDTVAGGGGAVAGSRKVHEDG